jgi:4-hydroxy-2-oxoheptanedioate aldolase
MENAVRRKLERGERVLGMMHFTASPMIIEVMASAGLDFAIIDMEHSPIDLGVAAHLTRAADAAGLTPLFRVPEGDLDPGLINKMLNVGVRGVVIPHADRAMCQAALHAVRYAPEGGRGSCPAVRSARYGQADWGAFMRNLNKETLVIPLIEEKSVLDDIGSILAMPGIDIVFVGPFDLAIDLGVPGADFTHTKMAAALAHVVGEAKKHGKWVMTSVGARIDQRYGAEIFARGVSMISYSADALVFQQACRDIAALGKVTA